MKRNLAIILLLCFAAALHTMFSAESVPRIMQHTIVLQGTITNTTVDQASAARLDLVIDGEIAAATLRTEPPLTGSGRLQGRMRGGWCELQGKLEAGMAITLRGVLNDREFRGTYVANVPGSPAQYGKFQLAVQPAPQR